MFGNETPILQQVIRYAVLPNQILLLLMTFEHLLEQPFQIGLALGRVPTPVEVHSLEQLVKHEPPLILLTLSFDVLDGLNVVGSDLIELQLPEPPLERWYLVLVIALVLRQGGDLIPFD